MRQQIVAGNWKMNKTAVEAEALVRNVIEILSKNPSESVVVFAPPFVHLQRVAQIISQSPVHVSRVFTAAQDCHWEESGAYTGEVSAAMIKSVGATHAIIGHSERRTYFKENNQLLARKIDVAFKNELLPIYCCGESIMERKNDHHFKTIEKQIAEGLFHLSENDFLNVIIAYEPVWAIGTGETATPEQAQEMHAFIRDLLSQKYGGETAENISILYGGSCKPSNSKVLFAQPDIDGGLIGGASLEAEDFLAIIHSF
ncbi:MAG: triose-phosphate isomerase [Flavobacteriales bacterium]|nr:MAG: triose-phosphate isomerase [Flavobacteriales bacterium]